MYNVSTQKTNDQKSELSILIVCLTCIFLFLTSAQSTAQRVFEGLVFCARKIIPALFPVIFTTDILQRSGALSFASSLLYPLMLKTKKNPAVIIPCLAGLICGFPVGAKIIRDTEKKGDITKKEADCLLAGSNCASPAFVISSVGAGMYSNIKLGVALWLVSTLMSLLLSLWLLPDKDENTPNHPKHQHNKTSFAETFCESAKSTSASILNIVCLITYFYTLSETLGWLMIRSGASEVTVALLGSLLELGSGCNKSSMLSSPYSVYLSAFAIGFSGICVYFQVKSEAHDGANMQIYLLIKTVCS